jgi:thioredoxin reductase (NADPH)
MRIRAEGEREGRERYGAQQWPKLPGPRPTRLRPAEFPQAAVHLAAHAATVTILVRGVGLAETMSDYLITQIEATTDIHVRTRVEVVAGDGSDGLRELTLRDTRSNTTSIEPADALFVLIGAQLLFAVGDVRHRSIKRVASAVGEGATVISVIHSYLARARNQTAVRAQGCVVA